MKPFVIAIALPALLLGVGGCGTLQPSSTYLPQGQAAPAGGASQLSAAQPNQVNGILNDLIRTATDTMATELNRSMQDKIQEAGSNLRN
ncbi:hypothetical protein [Pseudomonas indica]|uniref:hypothetical protein n=1 Tax=Pseudomonas indica TaxID=137658 RepID=UPI0023F8282E|nr:hypothetical protein [Pseudomonas indica]MBU3059290.1 hypothetical protein [Pseudomonas indica]